VVTNSAFVFGTDSNNIASYARSGDGSLKQVASTLAVGSNGSELWAIGAMTLDHTGQTLYAAEDAGSDDNFYVFFNIAANGSITKIGQIGPNVDYTSPLVFSPDNQNAYGFGCFHIGWDITGFHRNSDGSLTQFDTTANTQSGPFYLGSGQMYCPEGEAVSQMGYMALADTAVNTNTLGVGVYKINADGTLTFVQNSTLETQLSEGSNGCCFPVAMSFDRTGQFLALAGSGGIQMYRLMPGGTLTPLGGVQAPGPSYLGVQWDADNHVYAVSSSGLQVFTNSQGVLTPAPGSPHMAGAAGSLAVLPTH
jgi:6-phosphogluconolactonase (cycloisomerase 2 family)